MKYQRIVQKETGQICDKPSHHLDEWPPARMDNAPETRIKRGTSILIKGLSQNDAGSF
jgi:hypothetical protein